MAKAKVVIRKDRSKGCELCISVCPKHILAIDDTEVNINGYHAVNIIAEEECLSLIHIYKLRSLSLFRGYSASVDRLQRQEKRLQE